MRVFFTNLGCKLNQAEVEQLMRSFSAAGHRVVASLDEADLHVVNTCTVTQTAARSTRKVAGKARRQGLPVRTVLTGCFVDENPAAAASLAGVDLVVPNQHKDRLLDLVVEAFPEATGPAVPVPYVDLPFGNTRALVKIEDGCNMRCSFCIIPHTRGAQRSRPLAEVVAEVRALVSRGYKEIVATGVQISAYRSGDAGLVELVEALLAKTDCARLRLTSIAPWDLDERLLELFADRRLCRHLHLSLQSGSTATLRRMRRPYSSASFLKLLDQVRAAVPGVAVTTDVIVGFPGETSREFTESMDTVEEAGFAKVHVFPFSPRPGTDAAGLPGQVPAAVKRTRTQAMLEVAARAECDFLTSHLGSREVVLWEKPKNGRAQGLTDNYIRVFADDAAAGLRNRLTPVELVGLTEGAMVGRPLRTAAAGNRMARQPELTRSAI